MPLRIACDLDGTIADMDRALQREAEALFGPDVDLHAASVLPLAPLQSPANFGGAQPEAPAPPDAAPDAPLARRPLSDRERRRLWQRVGEVDGFWRGLTETEPGAVARLAAMAEQHRWEVLFVTQRPEGAGATPQLQTQQWLRAHGFEFPSVFVMQGSRGKLADALALDAVVDDRPDNCLDIVTDSTARAILVWRQDPAGLPPGAQRMGITITLSFNAALDELEKLMIARQKKGGFFGRIRDAIGI
jgi:hypothetical protein